MMCDVGGGVATISDFSATVSLGEKPSLLCVFWRCCFQCLERACIPVMEQGGDQVQFFDVYCLKQERKMQEVILRLRCSMPQDPPSSRK